VCDEQDKARSQRDEVRAERDEAGAEHSKKLLWMRSLRFHETGRVIEEMNGEIDRLKAELRLANLRAMKHECKRDEGRATGRSVWAVIKGGGKCTVCLDRPSASARCVWTVPLCRAGTDGCARMRSAARSSTGIPSVGVRSAERR
jgi:hypothetical protein